MCNSSGGIVGKLLTPPVSSRIEISGPHVRAASWEGDQDGALYSWALGVGGGGAEPASAACLTLLYLGTTLESNKPGWSSG